MIHLMLDDACRESAEYKCLLASGYIRISNLDTRISLDVPTLSWHTQTPLIIDLCLRRVLEDHRVDHRDRTVVLILIVTHETHRDDALVRPDLRSCESDASIVLVADVFDHVLCERDILLPFAPCDLCALFPEDLVLLSDLYRKLHDDVDN